MSINLKFKMIYLNNKDFYKLMNFKNHQKYNQKYEYYL